MKGNVNDFEVSTEENNISKIDLGNNGYENLQTINKIN